jgi:hypothetical protein
MKQFQTRWARSALYTATAAALGCAAMVSPAPAQVCPYSTGECAFPPPDRQTSGSHVVAALANSLLGGTTAGLIRVSDGRSFADGFVSGAAGGLVGYGGKVLSVQRWNGAGLAGRQIGALGGSLVANAGAGDGPFDHVAVPVGPVRLHVTTRGPLRVQPKVDAGSVLFTAYAAAHPSMAIDWEATLGSGLAVFRDHRPANHWGRYLFGVILINHPPGAALPDEHFDRVQRHERVHALQHDFSAIAIGERFERWFLSHVPHGSRVPGSVDLGLDFLLWGGLTVILPRDAQLWEHEAYFLTPAPAPASRP